MVYESETGVTLLDFSNIKFDLIDETLPFFQCASLQTKNETLDVISKRPGLFTYTLHQSLRYISPFIPVPYRSINVDFDFAKRFLSIDTQMMLDCIIDWCIKDSENLIEHQYDQDVILIHNRYGIPLHKHGIQHGDVAISYCIKMTDKIAEPAVFEIDGEPIDIFAHGSRISRFILDTRHLSHQVITSPDDTNVYMWFVRDGCKLFENRNMTSVRRYQHAIY